jgi:hypothetical protein
MPRAISALLCLCLAAPGLAAQSGLFEQGKRLPALELPTIDGTQTINLAELRGKKLLLIQFASW